jgi:hypothetical protein
MIINMIIKDDNKYDNDHYDRYYVEHVYRQPLFGRNPSQELSEETGSLVDEHMKATTCSHRTRILAWQSTSSRRASDFPYGT